MHRSEPAEGERTGASRARQRGPPAAADRGPIRPEPFGPPYPDGLVEVLAVDGLAPQPRPYYRAFLDDTYLTEQIRDALVRDVNTALPVAARWIERTPHRPSASLKRNHANPQSLCPVPVRDLSQVISGPAVSPFDQRVALWQPAGARVGSRQAGVLTSAACGGVYEAGRPQR